MGILDGLLGGILAPVRDIISEVVVDKDKRDQIMLQLAEIEDRGEQRLHDELMGQIAVNNSEAQTRSVFIAGWRPFIGWTGGFGIAWTFVAGPMVEFLARLFGWHGTMPVIDTGQLMTLVMAMLGVGAMRSYDKMKGTSNDVLRSPVPATPAPSIIQRAQTALASLPLNTPWSK